VLKLFIKNKSNIFFSTKKNSFTPFSALSIFGAKPPSSPTFVASRPYSAFILNIFSFFEEHFQIIIIYLTNFLNDDKLLNPYA